MRNRPDVKWLVAALLLLSPACGVSTRGPAIETGVVTAEAPAPRVTEATADAAQTAEDTAQTAEDTAQTAEDTAQTAEDTAQTEQRGEAETPATGSVRWRIEAAGDGADGLAFTEVNGLDTAEALLLVADAYGGVYGFDTEGALVLLASPGEIGYVVDVKAGPGGRFYMADSALHQVTMFDADGGLLGAFGGLGSGPGEFGGDSPRALAVSSSGEVFVLDPNVNAAGDAVVRVQVFDPDGVFVRSLPIDPSWDVRAMAVGPDETLLLVSPEGFVAELEPEEGRLIQRLGLGTLTTAYPVGLAVDAAGNLYVTTQVPAAVAVLGPAGELVGWMGEEGLRTEEGWDAGTFLFPSAVAVTPDGETVFVADAYPPFAYVTAMGR